MPRNFIIKWGSLEGHKTEPRWEGLGKPLDRTFLISSMSLATIEMVPILILQLSLNYMECKTRTFIRCAGFVEMAIASGVGFTWVSVKDHIENVFKSYKVNFMKYMIDCISSFVRLDFILIRKSQPPMSIWANFKILKRGGEFLFFI